MNYETKCKRCGEININEYTIKEANIRNDLGKEEHSVLVQYLDAFVSFNIDISQELNCTKCNKLTFQVILCANY